MSFWGAEVMSNEICCYKLFRRSQQLSRYVGSRTKLFYNRVSLLHKAEWEYSLPRHSCCKVEVCPCG